MENSRRFFNQADVREFQPLINLSEEVKMKKGRPRHFAAAASVRLKGRIERGARKIAAVP